MADKAELLTERALLLDQKLQLRTAGLGDALTDAQEARLECVRAQLELIEAHERIDRLNQNYIAAVKGRAAFRDALVEARERINQLFACVCNFADPTYWSDDMRWTGKRNPIEYAQWTIDNPAPAIPENVTPPSNREPADSGAVLETVGDSSPGGFETDMSSESDEEAGFPADQDGPDDPCDHDEASYDILTGRAHCHRCDHVWYPDPVAARALNPLA
jgi:hypothetical protein